MPVGGRSARMFRKCHPERSYRGLEAASVTFITAKADNP